MKIAHLLMKGKIFCEAESVMKPHIKIVANLLHGEMHAVIKVEQKLWSDNEHSMTMTVTLAIHSHKGIHMGGMGFSHPL